MYHGAQGIRGVTVGKHCGSVTVRILGCWNSFKIFSLFSYLYIKFINIIKFNKKSLYIGYVLYYLFQFIVLLLS